MQGMKRLSLMLLLVAFALMSHAQHQQKWKAPKRPKRPKWEAPKQKAPEVIDVWRPYSVSDNWFIQLQGGVSLSLAENMRGHKFQKIWQPMFDFSVGKQFSNAWTTRVALSYKKQKGWASKEAIATSSLLQRGDYTFQMVTAHLDEMLSLTRLLCPYNELRRLDIQVFAGVGMNYSFDFDDKVDSWARYGYPVDATDHINLGIRGGVLTMFKLNDTADLTLQGVYHVVGDNYNGVQHTSKSAYDSYLDVSVGVCLHLMDHYGNSRFYKVRRWEATSLRTAQPQVAHLLDAEKQNEYQARAASERVAIGELMNTRISFYIDRTFVNDAQMENLRIIADFLRQHPQVNLLIKGYSGASQHDETALRQLAQRRAVAVQKALIRHHDVDPRRIHIWYDEQAAPPFPMQGEWIDGVVFLMEERPDAP